MKIIPPLVYLAGLVIGFLANIWMPIKVVPSLVAWTSGGLLIFCGAVLAGSAVFKFKAVGTTVRPDRAASTLVIVGPYKITRNPMYLGLAFVYFGVALAGARCDPVDPLAGPVTRLSTGSENIYHSRPFEVHRGMPEYITMTGAARSSIRLANDF